MKLWRRFVDDTICFAKMDSLNCILLTINSFHKNIKFTIEIEQNSMILFLYVLLLRTPQKIHATVYHKIQILIYSYTGILLHPTTRNGGHSKLWYVEHMRPAQLINIYEMN